MMYAVGFVQRIIGKAESLVEMPERGRVVPEYSTPSVREIIVDSYRLVYRIRGDVVGIVGVIHGARILPIRWCTLARGSAQHAIDEVAVAVVVALPSLFIVSDFVRRAPRAFWGGGLMKPYLVQLACGVSVLVAGFFCLNYTNGSGVAHHAEWAAAHGLPTPSYPIFVAGAVLDALGAGICGHAIGRRRSRVTGDAA